MLAIGLFQNVGPYSVLAAAVIETEFRLSRGIYDNWIIRRDGESNREGTIIVVFDHVANAFGIRFGYRCYSRQKVAIPNGALTDRVGSNAGQRIIPVGEELCA